MTMTYITRENIDQLLNERRIYAAMNNGRWWQVRRNGATKLWKRDPMRIRIPIKAGMYSYAAIDESHFCADGALNSDYFRHVDDVPKGRKA